MAFWIGIVLFGGLGIWFEVYNLVKALVLGTAGGDLWRPLRIAVAGLFPAIVGATSLQMVFEDKIKAPRGAAVCAALIFLLLLFPTADRDIKAPVSAFNDFSASPFCASVEEWVVLAYSSTTDALCEPAGAMVRVRDTHRN